MEFLHGVIVVVTAGGVFVAGILGLILIYFLVQKIWPLMIGAVGCYFIWLYVDYEFAIMFGIVCVLGQIWWWHSTKEELPDYKKSASSHNPYDSNEAILPRYLDL